MEFVINLDAKSNKYAFYGLTCNPFSSRFTPNELEHLAKDALRNGITKKLMPEYLARLGLSHEVIRILKKNLRSKCKYQIKISGREMEVCQFA